MFGPSALARSAGRSEPSAAALAQAASPAASAVQSTTNLSELKTFISSNRCVAVFFTSATCRPCHVIAPEFENMIRERKSAPAQRPAAGTSSNADRVIGVKVDIALARDIATQYQIAGTPTFMFFLNGQKVRRMAFDLQLRSHAESNSSKFSEFRGADASELKNSLDLLLFTAYPRKCVHSQLSKFGTLIIVTAHPHTSISTRTLDNMPRSPILYTQSTQMGGIFGKLSTFIKESNINVDVAALEKLKVAMTEKFEKSSTSLALPEGWSKTVNDLLMLLPLECLFPAVDVVRLLVLEDAVRSYYVTEKDATIIRLFNRLSTAPSGTVPKALSLMVLRLACNLFAHPTSTSFVLSVTQTLPPNHTPFRTTTTALLIESLLSPETAVRQGAASLAFNTSIVERKNREGGDATASGAEDEGIHEEWVSELAAAVGKALEDEEEDEIGEFCVLLSQIVRFELVLSPSSC
ncbi:hypothetical protein HDV00_005037 [Rhizophlyctis rosea]|nr:hypothetical protein HDV00_005037 [Rhizophlyctis rosea]